ncbi:hypothetical protein BH11MYX4_BH11MYX4_38780 [soil metagenome]
MSTVSSIGKKSASGVGAPEAGPAPIPASASLGTSLPAPNMDVATATGDVMAMLYALTAKQRDQGTRQRASTAQDQGTQREVAFNRMRDELQAAKDAENDGGWLGKVTKTLDAITDAVVGGNPLQEAAHHLADLTGVDQFEIAYDFIRPDATLHGAVLLATAVTGEKKLAQGYDVVAASSSLRTRFQGVADASGEKKVMDVYAVTRDAIAMAMVTVGTCGTGSAAMFAVLSSAALAAEQKFDLLGGAGVGDDAKLALRLGAQAYMVAGNIACAFRLGASAAQAGSAAVSIINGAGEVSRGGVAVGRAAYEHEASLHLANAAEQENAQHRADRSLERIVAALRDMSKSYQRCLETIASSLNERDQSSLLVAQHIA